LTHVVQQSKVSSTMIMKFGDPEAAAPVVENPDELPDNNDLLSDILELIRSVSYERITELHLEQLDVNDLETVLQETALQIRAFKGTKRGRLALDFVTYILGPHIRQRAGVEARFPPEIGDELRQVYAKEKGGFTCMKVVYKGLKVLMPKEIVSKFATETTQEGTAIRKERRKKGMTKKADIVKNTITLSRFMGKLVKIGRASPPTRLKFQPRTKTWNPDPQDHILKLSQTDEPGWFFFAVNMHSYHTGILAVDRTTPQAPKIFWLDQYGKKGFNREITGKIERVFEEFRPSFRADTQIWQILIPPTDTEDECIVDDSNGLSSI
jgi:hypothetical protein